MSDDYNRMFTWIWDHMDDYDGYDSYSDVIEDLEDLRKSEEKRMGRDTVGTFLNQKTTFKQEILSHYDEPIKKNNDAFVDKIKNKIENSKTESDINSILKEVEDNKNRYEDSTYGTLSPLVIEKRNEIRTNIKEIEKEVAIKQEEEKQQKQYERVKAQIGRASSEAEFRTLDNERKNITNVELRRELGRLILDAQNKLDMSAENEYILNAREQIDSLTSLEQVSTLASRLSREAPTTRIENEALALLREKRDELKEQEQRDENI